MRWTPLARWASPSEVYFDVVSQFFWAIILKLMPARRVLLLIALVLVIVPGGEWTWTTGSGEVRAYALDFHFYGGLLMFALLILEVADRVVMKRDLQIAKEIQTWLLPANSPQVNGLEIAFATRPANTVAGDYYDVFARPCGGSQGETFLIAVADVAGKSIPAAMLMATFQASLKTLCSTPGSLIELVGRMNTYACSNSQNGRRFTTAFIAEYDPATRSLTYVNAGHNNPILRRQSGLVERLELGGMPLGIMPDAPYQYGTATLQAGDWLVIFTGLRGGRRRRTARKNTGRAALPHYDPLRRHADASDAAEQHHGRPGTLCRQRSAARRRDLHAAEGGVREDAWIKSSVRSRSPFSELSFLIY